MEMKRTSKRKEHGASRIQTGPMLLDKSMKKKLNPLREDEDQERIIPKKDFYKIKMQ